MKRLLDLLRARPSAAAALLDEADTPPRYFREVYRRNFWGGKESRSGPGSEGAFASQKVGLLTGILEEHGIRSILDLGCGDFHWMREIAPRLDRYHGVDTVKELVKANRSRYGSATATFQCLDLTDPRDQVRLDLRSADLVLCLDIFGHLLSDEVTSLLRFILGDLRFRYLLVTNRREPGSDAYLTRPKSRLEGIDLEAHPAFRAAALDRVGEYPALYPNDYFDLYRRDGERPTAGEDPRGPAA